MLVADAVLLRRNWWVVLAGAAFVVLGTVGAFAFDDSLFSLLSALVAFFGAIFGPVVFLRNAFPLGRAVRVEADAHVIVVGTGMRIATEDVVALKLVPLGARPIVELDRRRGPKIKLRMSTVDAEALAGLLGPRRSRFSLVIPFARRFVASLGILFGIALSFHHDEQALAFVAPCMFWGLILAWIGHFLRGSVVVGADGLAIRWGVRERFVPYRDVRHVRSGSWPSPSDTIVELVSGRTIRLRTIDRATREEERGAGSRALRGHVQNACERARSTGSDAIALAARLVPGPAVTAREWLQRIGAVTGGELGYRTAATSQAALDELLADPSAVGEARVAAAAALVRLDPDTGRVRVRVTAEASAEAVLKGALHALADAHDDASTEAALALALPGRARTPST